MHSYETLLLKLTENLNEILDTFFVGIYVSDQWDRKYRMLSHTIGTIPDELKDINQHKQLLHELLSNRSVMNGEEIFSSQSSDTDSKIIKLNASYRSVFLLLFFKKDYLSSHLISFIHSETDRLMSTIHDFFRNKDQDIKKEFLLDLSSQMNSLIEKKEIFNKLIASLQILYPNFSYNLLLSHDYETDGGLPIKLIEYSDDITKHLSAKAFTSGKIQIESHEDDQSLYAPLTGNQGIYGVIQIITPKELKFPTEEIEFIRKFANTAGNAIENAKLYQDSMQLAADLKHINDITHKLNSNLNFTEQIETVKKEILAICKASEIGFVYHREMISDFEVLENSTRFFHTKQGRTFVKYLSREMKEKEDSLFIGNYTNKFMQLPFKSLIVIPMTESGLMYGFVIITHENNSYFTFESFKLLQSLIYHSTLALTNALLRDTLEEAVITDYLTKLYSRSHLDEMLNKHMQTDQR